VRHAGVHLRAVRRIRARFAGMVPLPSRLAVRVSPSPGGEILQFEVAHDHATVIARGALHLA
jgi:hypothetical protein